MCLCARIYVRLNLFCYFFQLFLLAIFSQPIILKFIPEIYAKYANVTAILKLLSFFYFSNLMFYACGKLVELYHHLTCNQTAKMV